MSPDKASDYLQSTEGDWQTLMAERDPDGPFPLAFCGYETLATLGQVIVPRLYVSKFCDGRIIGFDYDHEQIVKPKDAEDRVYTWVRARIVEARDYQVHPKPTPRSARQLQVGHTILLDAFRHYDQGGLAFSSSAVVAAPSRLP